VAEYGISGYSFDETQGPACALACPAGTLFRNYFFSPPGCQEGEYGQTERCQLNTLDGLERLLDNPTNRYFHVRNGYTTATEDSLIRLNTVLDAWKQAGRWEELLASVRVGVQADTEVVFSRRFAEVPEKVLVLFSMQRV
jgi:hypothetical protein